MLLLEIHGMHFDTIQDRVVIAILQASNACRKNPERILAGPKMRSDLDAESRRRTGLTGSGTAGR